MDELKKPLPRQEQRGVTNDTNRHNMYVLDGGGYLHLRNAKTA